MSSAHISVDTAFIIQLLINRFGGLQAFETLIFSKEFFRALTNFGGRAISAHCR